MKQPQCTTTAQCYKELARVIDLAGVKSAQEVFELGYLTWYGEKYQMLKIPIFDEPEKWEFAIAKLEGKPVFLGDELYDCDGEKHIVPYVNKTGRVMDISDGCEWTWHPPAPKTGMIELPMNAIRFLATMNDHNTSTVRAACKAFIDKQKETK